MPVPTRFWEAHPGRTLVGRLQTGSDVVEEIERTCAERGILAAEVTVVGAVQHAAYAYYDQAALRYIELASAGHHELAAGWGTSRCATAARSSTPTQRSPTSVHPDALPRSGWALARVVPPLPQRGAHSKC